MEFKRGDLVKLKSFKDEIFKIQYKSEYSNNNYAVKRLKPPLGFFVAHKDRITKLTRDEVFWFYLNNGDSND